jgi:NAD(P)H-dependent FMN reductase
MRPGMKVVAFNGSARKGGNTALLVQRVFSELKSEGIETELVEQDAEGMATMEKLGRNMAWLLKKLQ